MKFKKTPENIRLGITEYLPCVNKSFSYFTPGSFMNATRGMLFLSNHYRYIVVGMGCDSTVGFCNIPFL